MITDRVQSRLDLAEQLGADRVVNIDKEDPYQAVEEFTNGEGASAVIEAVGLEATIRQSMEFVAPSRSGGLAWPFGRRVEAAGHLAHQEGRRFPRLPLELATSSLE